MTLHTRLRVTAPLGHVDLPLLWEKVLADLIAVSDPSASHEWKGDDLVRATVIGQGLAALTDAHVGPDRGELPRDDHPEWADPEEDYDGLDHDPHAWAEVGWDTAYGYSDALGGCGTLHARLIVSLGSWLDKHGLPWAWWDESRGEWHNGPGRLGDLVEAGREASAWFASILPVLLQNITENPRA